MNKVSNINISSSTKLPTPDELRLSIHKSEEHAAFIHQSREAIHRIIFGDDSRTLMVVGPCSIHDLESGREYAQKLKSLADRVQDRICIVMRVYFEKPRTTVGWKGLIMDPQLDGSSNIQEGLAIARKFLLEVINIGLPTSTELLDPITPQYIADLVSWAAIGARTTESQTHRQMASGLSMPLGFKNNTEGSIAPAINAIKAASKSQTFLGIDMEGLASAVTTSGNPNCHVILRGGNPGPNYQSAHVQKTQEALNQNGLIPAVMVDCSHENSGKNPDKSAEVFRDVIEQIAQGDQHLIGLMLESHLHKGAQSLKNKDELQYGISITDPCLDWETTEELILEAYQKLTPQLV